MCLCIWYTLRQQCVHTTCGGVIFSPSHLVTGLYHFYSKTNQMHKFRKFILFCSSTLHVSDGLSVHYQESKTVHTASDICQTDSADCVLAGTRCSISFSLARSQQNLTYSWCCMHSLRLLMMDGKTETFRVLLQNKISLRNWCNSLVLLRKYITMHSPMNVKFIPVWNIMIGQNFEQ